MTQSVSSPFRVRIVAPGTGTPPSWALAQPIGRWYTVPNTAQTLVREPDTIAAAPAGYQAGNTSARLNAWCGPSFRKRESVLILGPTGGHGDYFGNWMTQVVLGTETPSIEVLDPGTPWDGMYANSTFHSDLKPVATHSYYAHVFSDERDWMLYFGVTSHLKTDQGAGFPGPNAPAGWPYTVAANDSFHGVAAYDYRGRRWLHPSTVPPVSMAARGNFTASPVARHPASGDVYWGRDGDPNGGFYKWDQATNAHVMLARTYPVNYTATAIDSTRNRMFFSGSALTPVAYRPRVFDCGSGQATEVPLSGPSAEIVKQNHPDYPGPAYPGMVYVPGLDRFLFAINNRSLGKIELHEIHPESFLCTPFATTGTQPAAAVNGIETKLHFAPELRGLVLMNAYNEGVKYLRLT